MTTDTTRGPDRLIWLSLLALLAAALIADQARANLHAEARAADAVTAILDAPLTAAEWCRMQRDVLAGDGDIGFGSGLHEASAGRPAPVDALALRNRRSRDLDASR